MTDDLGRQVRQRLGQAVLPSAPSKLHDEIEALRTMPASLPARRRRLRPPLVLVAAALVTMAVVAAGVGGAGGQHQDQRDQARASSPASPLSPPPVGLAAPGLIGFDSDGAVVVVHSDGSGLQTLASGTPDLSPTFSPDGRWIAFWARNRFASDSTFRLTVMASDGSHRHFAGGRFSWEGWIAHEFPLPAIAWGPDSQRVAYSDGQRIYVVERDRTYPDDLGMGSQATDPLGDPSVRAIDPSWSSDGAAIAFDEGGAAAAGTAGGSSVYVMNADGTNVRRISRANGNEKAFERPQWQPGGTLIAYYADDPNATDGEHDIYVASEDGVSEARVTTDPADEFFPVWSPDGSRLAFLRAVDAATAQIVITDPNGANPVVSAALPLDGALPVWAPDGRSILAFVASSTKGRYGAIRLSTDDAKTEGSLDLVQSVGDGSWQRLGPVG